MKLLKPLCLFVFLQISTSVNLQTVSNYRHIPKTKWQIELPNTKLTADSSIPGFIDPAQKMVLQIYQLTNDWMVIKQVFSDALSKSKPVKQQLLEIEGCKGMYEQVTVDSANILQQFLAPWLTETPATLHFMVIGKENESLVLIGAYPFALPDSFDLAFEQSLLHIRRQIE